MCDADKVRFDDINVCADSGFDQLWVDASYKFSSLVDEAPFELSVLEIKLDKLVLSDIMLKLFLDKEDWSRFLTFLSELKKFKFDDLTSLNL